VSTVRPRLSTVLVVIVSRRAALRNFARIDAFVRNTSQFGTAAISASRLSKNACRVEVSVLIAAPFVPAEMSCDPVRRVLSPLNAFASEPVSPLMNVSLNCARPRGPSSPPASPAGPAGWTG
jgi:hypothetical protein